MVWDAGVAHQWVGQSRRPSGTRSVLRRIQLPSGPQYVSGGAQGTSEHTDKTKIVVEEEFNENSPKLSQGCEKLLDAIRF